MKAKPVKKLDPRSTLAENAARTVRVRLKELRSFAPAALNPENTRDQHDMRIAAKRLRYVLEATDLCFPEPARVARRCARELQGILGELHDCDVLLPRVEEQLTKTRHRNSEAVRIAAGTAPDLDPALAQGPDTAAHRGLELLATYLTARRSLLFRRFADFWAEQERRATWDRLDQAAKQVLGESKSSRPVLDPSPTVHRNSHPV